MTLEINKTKENLILEPISKDHIKKTYDWISDPEFRKEFMVRGENSWEKHIHYFDNLLNDPSQQGYAILLSDLHIGNCGFKYIDYSKKIAELWIYIGSIDARGIGLGGQALDRLLKNGTNDLSLNRVCVHVAHNNESAIKLYKRSGFLKYGNCSEEWKDRDVDMIRMLWRA